MKKLTEYKDEEALDLLADLLEPSVRIFQDEEFRAAARAKESVKAASIAIRNHKQDILFLLARLEGVPQEEYHCTIATLPQTVMELMNDPDLVRFFTSQGQTVAETASGSPTESTGDGD